MSTPELIQRIKQLEASAEVTWNEAIKIREELERVNAPTPRKGKRGIAPEILKQMDKKIAARRAKRLAKCKNIHS